MHRYETNTQYLWALLQEMPCNKPILRRAQNHFAPDRIPTWIYMQEWFHYMEHRYGITLQTANNGGEQFIGPYRVDGFHEEEK